MTEPDDRATERHTPTEEFIIEARRQRIANLQTMLALAHFGVPILRDREIDDRTREITK